MVHIYIIITNIINLDYLVILITIIMLNEVFVATI